MSCVELRELVRDSPLRARSLLTVRAAISSARRSEEPWSSSLFLTCSYWRARLLPFLTPLGGMSNLPRSLYLPLRRYPRRHTRNGSGSFRCGVVGYRDSVGAETTRPVSETATAHMTPREDRSEAADGRPETRLQRLDRNLEEMTGELRVVV